MYEKSVSICLNYTPSTMHRFDLDYQILRECVRLRCDVYSPIGSYTHKHNIENIEFQETLAKLMAEVCFDLEITTEFIHRKANALKTRPL